LDPAYVSAHQWFALYLSAMGRPEEAMEQIRQAQALDPMSPNVRAAGGLIAYHARNYDLAITECKSALELNPDFIPALTVLSHVYVQKKMFAQAEAGYQRLIQLTHGFVMEYLADLGYLYGASGRQTEALKMLGMLRDRDRQVPFVPFTFDALIYEGLGRRDETIATLQKASDQNDPSLIWLRSDPRWDLVRNDSRIAALLPPAVPASKQ
jgi:tetratricopeptide (TPR) repeat protein